MRGVRTRQRRQAAIDAMGEVFSAPSSSSALVLVAVFVPVAFFPGTTGRMYQQFSLTIAFSVVLSVFNAVTFTPALSALLLEKEAHEGRVLQRASNGSSTAARRATSRRARSGSCGTAGSMVLLFLAHARRDVCGLPVGADGVRAGRGRGLLHHPSFRRRRARRSSTRPTSRRRPRRSCWRPSRKSSRCSRSAGSASAAPAPNQGHAVRAAQGLTTSGATESQSRRPCSARLRGTLIGGISGAIVVPFAAAADPGPVAVRRIPVRGARPDGRRHREPGGGHAGAGAAAATSRAELRGLFTRSPTDDPQLVVDIDRERRAVLGHAAQPGHRRAAGVPRIAVRERLRLQQPRLSRVRAGGSAVPRRPDDAARSSTRGRRTARWCRVEPGASSARDDGAAGHQPLQPVPIGRDQRRGGAGRAARARRCRRCRSIAQQNLPDRLRLTRGPASRSRRSRPARRPAYIFALEPAARVPVARGAVRELGAAVHHPAGRAARGARRAQRAGPARVRQRHLLPGRPGHADRPRGEELDPDRRVRRAAARAGAVDRRRRDRSRRASGCARF